MAGEATHDGIPPIRLDGRVAIVTGSGRGLGREYALALAARGARVLVNGTGLSGDGAEERLVDEIRRGGGDAFALLGSVTDRVWVDEMVARVKERWGRVDILVNNAGFVRDRSFGKLDVDDFAAVLDVHVMGAVYCTKAVWSGMTEQRYGRVVLIGSSSGLAGAFGQSAYAAAKMALVGLMNTLGIEGEAKNVRVNCLAPAGVSRMNHGVLSAEERAIFAADKVAPGVVFLASEQAPNRVILMGGGGSFERAYVSFTQGVALGEVSPEELARRFAEISDRSDDLLPHDMRAQIANEMKHWTTTDGA